MSDQTAVATPQKSAPAVVSELPIERALAAMKEKFSAALPAHIPADRFVRVAAIAVQKADIRAVAESQQGRQSIYAACLRAASDGLLLDGREAALVSFGREAAYMPMVAGIMKKARNSGEIAAIVAQVVYENDAFAVNYVTDGAPIVHQPTLGNRGKPIGVYAVARLNDGAWTQPEVMDMQQVEAVRQRSRSKSAGPWVTDFTEMARKTVIRRASKYWPSSTDRDGDLADIIRADDHLYEGEARVLEDEPPPPAKRGAAAALIAATVEQEAEPADADV